MQSFYLIKDAHGTAILRDSDTIRLLILSYLMKHIVCTLCKQHVRGMKALHLKFHSPTLYHIMKLGLTLIPSFVFCLFHALLIVISFLTSFSQTAGLFETEMSACVWAESGHVSGLSLYCRPNIFYCLGPCFNEKNDSMLSGTHLSVSLLYCLKEPENK